jgi:hypothetical protein
MNKITQRDMQVRVENEGIQLRGERACFAQRADVTLNDRRVLTLNKQGRVIVRSDNVKDTLSAVFTIS